MTQVVTATACASLAGCNLSGLNLTDASLAGATLTGANLNGVMLTGADLAGAALSGADFNMANLTGADLNGAAVSASTNFNKVTWSDTTCPDGHEQQQRRRHLRQQPVVGTLASWRAVKPVRRPRRP